MVANIATPLLGLLDVAISGHMGSAVYLAAIAVGGTVFNMLYWAFGFLRMGTSGMTAQAYGAGDMRHASVLLYRALTVALVAGMAMMAFQYFVIETGLGMMDVDTATLPAARRYVSIVIWGAPAVLVTTALTGWMLGMQDSRAGMVVSVAVNVVNIAVSVGLVYGVGMKIEGIAVGTLTAQWAGCGLALLMAMRHKRAKVTVKAVLDGRGLLSFFNVNVYIFLRTLCLIAVSVWFTRAGAGHGTLTLAANALLMQLFICFSYFMDGFAYAGEALAGKYSGAGDRVRFHACVKHLMATGAILATIFTLMYWGCGEWFLSVLSDDAGVALTAVRYLPWAVAIPVVSFAAFVWDGVFIGVTATGEMFVSILCASAAFFITYALTPAMGNHGLWLSFLVYLGLRGIVQSVLFLVGKKRFSMPFSLKNGKIGQ